MMFGRKKKEGFPFLWEKSNLQGKVDFFIGGHFTRQSDTFSKVGTLPGKVEFGSPFEQSPIGPDPDDFCTDFHFVLNRQFDPRSIQISSYGC